MGMHPACFAFEACEENPLAVLPKLRTAQGTQQPCTFPVADETISAAQYRPLLSRAWTAWLGICCVARHQSLTCGGADAVSLHAPGSWWCLPSQTWHDGLRHALCHSACGSTGRAQRAHDGGCSSTPCTCPMTSHQTASGTAVTECVYLSVCA